MELWDRLMKHESIGLEDLFAVQAAECRALCHEKAETMNRMSFRQASPSVVVPDRVA